MAFFFTDLEMFSLNHNCNASLEKEEEIEYKEFSPGKKTKRTTTAFTVAIFLLLVLCAIFIILFAIEKNKLREQLTQETVQPKFKICTSRECLFAAIGKYT